MKSIQSEHEPLEARLQDAVERIRVLEARNAALEAEAAALRTELEPRRRWPGPERQYLGEDELLRRVLGQAGVTVFNEKRNFEIVWILNPFPNFFDPHPEGKTEAEVMPLPDAERLMAIKAQVFDTGVGTRVDVWLNVNGEACFYDYVVEPIHGEGGEVTAVLGSAVDITERKHTYDALQEAEEALRRSEVRLRLALDAAHLAAWEWDPETELIEQLSPFSLELDGQAFSKEAFFDLVHPDDLDELQRTIAEAFEKKGKFARELQVRMKGDAYRWIEARGQVVQDPGGGQERVEGVVGDITDRKRSEQALQEYAAKLEQANRNLNDYASIASHDLQEPLRKIKSFAQMLVRRHGASLNEEGSELAERMSKSAERMEAMVQNLLDLSRVGGRELKLAQVDLSQTLQEVLGDLDVKIQETGGQIEAGPLPTIRADRVQMQQLFQNLISNALKFHAPGTAPVVQVWAEREPRGGVTLFVRDQGIGFDPRFSEHIFEPLRRVHERSRYEGTGMGLAIVRKIVERHGGEIGATSEPGKGTTVRIRLPGVR